MLKKKAYNKKYYENNQLIWLEKINCTVCGKNYDKIHKVRHYKSKDHIIAEKGETIKKLEGIILEMQSTNNTIKI
jgi:hypothetical protein